MNNLADILIKNFPKEVKLEDGTAITLRPLLKDDEQNFLAYFRSLAPEERVVLREEVTDRKVIENWMETLDYDLVLPLSPSTGSGSSAPPRCNSTSAPGPSTRARCACPPIPNTGPRAWGPC